MNGSTDSDPSGPPPDWNRGLNALVTIGLGGAGLAAWAILYLRAFGVPMW